MTVGPYFRKPLERILGRLPRSKSNDPNLQKALDAFLSSRSEAERGDAGTRYTISYPIQTDIMPHIWYDRSPRRPPNVVPYCEDDMSASTIKEALIQLGTLLNWMQYVVCGLAALASYGYTVRLPREMTICCPSSAKYEMFNWIAAAGMPCNPKHPDSFGIELSDGSVRKVAIEWMNDEAFEELPTARPVKYSVLENTYTPAATCVTTMPILLDSYAGLYMNSRDPSTSKVLEEEMMWLLRRIVADRSPGQLLRKEVIPNVLNPDFWSMFSQKRPDAAELWTHAWDDRLPLRPVRAVADLQHPAQPSQEDAMAREQQQTRHFTQPVPWGNFMASSSSHSVESDRSAHMRFLTPDESANPHDILFVPVGYPSA